MGGCCSSLSSVGDEDTLYAGEMAERKRGSVPSSNGKGYSRKASDCTGSSGNRQTRKECILLLLGSGESGKSTIVKQMKIIHQNGYSREELLSFKSCIYRNVIECARCLIMAASNSNISFASPENADIESRLLRLRYDAGSDDIITPQIANDILSLYRDPAVGDLFDKTDQYYLPDSAPYFFENCVRIGDPGYVPNVQDVLQARSKTSGIQETRFSMDELDIHMIDIGGQRSERRKWIQTFDRVTSVIFCVALSEYNQTLREQPNQNRMAESLAVFESILNSKWFVRTSIILFLNKVDLFREKLEKFPLQNYFPEYRGGSSANNAAKFILWRFTQGNRAKLAIYPHLTQATDTKNIKLVFSAVKLTILQNALKDSGIM